MLTRGSPPIEVTYLCDTQVQAKYLRTTRAVKCEPCSALLLKPVRTQARKKTMISLCHHIVPSLLVATT